MSFGSNVIQLLSFCHIELYILIFLIFSNHHTCIDFISRFDEQRTKFLRTYQGICSCYAISRSDHRPFFWFLNGALIWTILYKLTLEHSSALSFIEKLTTQSDQPSCRNIEDKLLLIISQINTRHIITFATVHLIDDHTGIAGIDFDEDFFIRFRLLSFNFLGNHLRRRNHQFKASSSHAFKKNTQVEVTSTKHTDFVFA